jgi:hypothetical protein
MQARKRSHWKSKLGECRAQDDGKEITERIHVAKDPASAKIRKAERVGRKKMDASHT